MIRKTTLSLTKRSFATPAMARMVRTGRNEQKQEQKTSSNETFYFQAAAAGAVVLTAATLMMNEQENTAFAADVNVEALRNDIISILENEKYDDGSYGPVLVRLAWHACGTYNKEDGSGGSNGATMRFGPEAGHGANAGLDIARALLEPVAQKHPNVSVSDLWQFAAAVAIEEMGGPKIPFRFGRVDKPDASHCTPDGRLPDADKGAQHLRNIFYRMGFNDQEIVALSGAHALGRCHTTRSGFDGPWSFSPTMFTNDYFVKLMEEKWNVRSWKGPKQYEDSSKKLMMLPTDMVLIEDPSFFKYVQIYGKDEEVFFRDFAKAFSKLQELGVPAFQKAWYQFW